MLLFPNFTRHHLITHTYDVTYDTFIYFKLQVIQQVHPHVGQRRVAERLRALLHSRVYPSEIAGRFSIFIRRKLRGVGDDDITGLVAAQNSRSSKVSHEWLAIYRENNITNNRNSTPSPQNNSNCYTRGPVELQAYGSCYTTGEKRTIEQTTGTMSLAPKTIAIATQEDQ